MKITYQWLKQYVDFDWSPEELVERLTMLGLEVEGVEKRAGEFEGVVVAQVITKEQHPNADKLSVCRVNDGRGERQIVCGAQNFKAGDKVPLILPGASLPPKSGETTPFTIKVGKIRGVESHGMMCSAEELGLPPKEDGLLILDPKADVGQGLALHLGRTGSDTIYDLEVTPNRPDLNSVIGIAREISALSGNPLRKPSVEWDSSFDSNQGVEGSVSVNIQDPDLCPRYTARVVRGVKVGNSPEWLKTALEKLGVRSINNVVDATNYVMLESGQPLHAFDYHLVAKSPTGTPMIVVRRAAEAEAFTTLDGQVRRLTPEALLIADAGKGIALAGVMGGLNSEIKENTVDVLIESAYFEATNIRRTSKRLGLRTDASYRFERGADHEICDWASRRVVKLILETAGGRVEQGVVDAYSKPGENRYVSLRPSRTDKLLGIQIPEAKQIDYLTALGLIPGLAGGEGEDRVVEFGIPSWRIDLKREADLVEEVGRLLGVNQIPATPPRVCLGNHPFDKVFDQIGEVRGVLCSAGLSEAQGQTLISGVMAQKSAGVEGLVALANPLSADMDTLRPSLVPGLLDSMRHNASRKNLDLGLFEIGRVFVRTPGGMKEERRVAMMMTGVRSPVFWSGEDRGALVGVPDLKGVVEQLLEGLGLRGVTFTKKNEAGAFYYESAQIALGGKLVLGEIGLMHPTLTRSFDLRNAVVAAELNLDNLLTRRNPAKSFKPLPEFPPIRRDLALMVSESKTHDSVLQSVKQAKVPNLESVELFDVFRGKTVVDGCKSMAYSFTYRNAEKTLTDAEVGAAHEKLTQHLLQHLKASIR